MRLRYPGPIGRGTAFSSGRVWPRFLTRPGPHAKPYVAVGSTVA